MHGLGRRRDGRAAALILGPPPDALRLFSIRRWVTGSTNKGQDTMSGGNWKEMFNAACEGDLALLAYHVEHGVDVNYAHPEFLSTPLVACILAGQEAAALYLLDHGASPHLHSEFDGLTPAQAARQQGLAAVVHRLHDLGARAAEAPPTPRPARARWWRWMG